MNFLVFLLVFSGACATPHHAYEHKKEVKEHKKEAKEEHKHREYGKLTQEQADTLVSKWEGPGRDKWQLPESIIEELGIKPGQTVADIGSGGGYFTVRLSKEVGDNGKVYAVDVEKKFLDSIAERLKEENLSNVELIHAKLDDPQLAEESVDMIFICNVWHHVAGREAYIWKLYSALKPNGKMVVIDFRYQQPQLKPVNIDHRIPRSQTLKLAREGGFKLHGEYLFLPRQYFLVFKKVIFPKKAD